MTPQLLQEARRTAAMAGPLILAQLAQVSMGFIDTIMVGRLGERSLAAVALGSATFFPLFVVAIGIVSAVSPFVSQAFGAGNYTEAGRAARQGLWLTLLLSVPAISALWFSAPFLRAIGQAPELAASSQAYLRAMAFGFLPALGFASLRNFAEGFSRTRPIMAIALTGVLLNIGADYVLMFGKLGFPALGLVGTGWASAAVYWSMFGLLVAYVSLSPVYRSSGVFRRIGRPDPAMLRELLHIGLPVGGLWGIEAGLFATTAFLMGTLGSTTLAAHQIAIQCASVTFMVPVGVSITAAVRVGQAMGRRDPHAARLAGFTGMLIGGAFMTLTALSFWIVPRPIVSLYLDLSNPANTAVANAAVGLLGIAAVFQVFDGLQATAGGALRGIKDTRVPMLVGLVSYWLIGLTSGAVFAFVLGAGGKGLWWGLVLGLAFASVLLALRFHLRMRRLLSPSSSVAEHADANGAEAGPESGESSAGPGPDRECPPG